MTTAAYPVARLTGGTHVEKLIENIIAADRKAREIIEKAEMQQETIIAETAKEKSKDWSANQCRIELNQLQIDEQSKRLEDELK